MKSVILCSLLAVLAAQADSTCMAGGGPSMSAAAESAVCSPLSLAPVALPPGIAGVPYVREIAAYGGRQPVNMMITSGALPPGLTMSPAGGISGTPNAAGTFTFSVTAADSCPSGMQKVSRVIRLNIAASAAEGQTLQPSVVIRSPLKVTVIATPPVFTLPPGKAAERVVSYRITAQPAETAPLNSPGGTFSVAGAVIASVASPLRTAVINGSLVLSENIAIPLQVIETAFREHAKIVYSRAFSGRETTALAVVEFVVSPEKGADR